MKTVVHNLDLILNQSNTVQKNHTILFSTCSYIHFPGIGAL